MFKRKNMCKKIWTFMFAFDIQNKIRNLRKERDLERRLDNWDIINIIMFSYIK